MTTTRTLFSRESERGCFGLVWFGLVWFCGKLAYTHEKKIPRDPHFEIPKKNLGVFFLMFSFLGFCDPEGAIPRIHCGG